MITIAVFSYKIEKCGRNESQYGGLATTVVDSDRNSSAASNDPVLSCDPPGELKDLLIFRNFPDFFDILSVAI